MTTRTPKHPGYYWMRDLSEKDQSDHLVWFSGGWIQFHGGPAYFSAKRDYPRAVFQGPVRPGKWGRVK